MDLWLLELVGTPTQGRTPPKGAWRPKARKLFPGCNAARCLTSNLVSMTEMQLATSTCSLELGVREAVARRSLLCCLKAFLIEHCCGRMGALSNIYLTKHRLSMPDSKTTRCLQCKTARFSAASTASLCKKEFVPLGSVLHRGGVTQRAHLQAA